MNAEAPSSSYLLGVADAVVATADAGTTGTHAQRTARPPWPWRAWFACIALPVALLVGLLVRYGVSVPHFDAWVAIAPLFEKYAAGTLGVADFFTANNEHRLVVPKLVFFANALLTHWNTRVESFLTLLVLVGVSAHCWHLLRVTGWRDTPSARLVFLFVAALLFSTVQVENLLWGFQFHFVLSLLCFSAICSLAVALPAPRNFLAVILLATVATTSMASGFVCWLLAVPVLWAAGGRAGRKWWTIYAVCAAVTIGWWLCSYERPKHHPSLAAVLEHPWAGAVYFAAYLGGPFAHGLSVPARDLAPWVGAILLAITAAAALGVWRARRDASLLRRAMPWLMISTLGLATAAITAVGRVGFGVPQALQSRYATYALLLPLGLLPVGVLLVAQLPRRRRRTGTALLAGASGCALLLLWLSQVAEFPRWATWRRTMLLERSLVQTVRFIDEPILVRRYATPDVPAFRGSVEALDRLGWLQPRPLTAPAIARIGEVDSPGEPGFGMIQQHLQDGGSLFLHGWAFLPEAHEPAHAVLLTRDDPSQGPVIIALAKLGVPRGDLARAAGDPIFEHTGWAIEMQRTQLPPGPQLVKAWAYDAERGRAWRMKGELAVEP